MMRRAVEALAFLGLASAVHAGVWIGFGGGGGAAPGAGAGGAAPLTLAAADPGMAALVARWDAPPAVATSVPVRTAPALAAPQSPAGVPAAEAGVPRPAPATALPAPAASAPAVPDRAPEAAVAETAPALATVRPRPRPEPRPERTARAGPGNEPETEAPLMSTAVAAPAPAQRAEGSGGRRTAGQQGEGAARALPAGTLRALEREWGAAILSRIARRQHYPAGDHGSGTARVSLTVGRDGRLQGVGLAASSGSAALDRAAVEAVRRAGRFPPAPAGLDKASYVFAVPMTFRRD